MQRSCDVCGAGYEAKRATSKYCSDRCRKRRQRGAKPAGVHRLPAPASSVESRTKAELEAVERESTPLGQAALVLARRIDANEDTGAGLASMTKQFQATLEAATKDIKQPASPLDRARDELSERRERRGA